MSGTLDVAPTATLFLNSYRRPLPKAASELHAHTPPDEYDFNFVFDVKTLSSDRVELRPFVPSLHAQPLYDGLVKYPEVEKWLPRNMPKTLHEVLEFAESMRANSATLMHAVYTDPPGYDTHVTKTADYAFAGVMSFVNASYDDMTAEPGCIIILPPFQRTHVLTHAAGTLMHRILDSPALGGLGLRRCQWFTTTLNNPSKNAALRLGFEFEGIIRAHRVLPPSKEGVRAGRPGVHHQEGMARDSWLSSITWEEWERAKREHVAKLMARK
ncbi:hypothetical protein JCM24511_07357 [Saitozyma sp. JCM 24511]|nr:hypothetical protein JCM24511_07357 [Saitozyma sp. JCM 24511]